MSTVLTRPRVPSKAHLAAFDPMLPFQQPANHDLATGIDLDIWSRQTGKTTVKAWRHVRRRFTGKTNLDCTYNSYSEGSGRDFIETVSRFAMDVFGELLEIEGVAAKDAIDDKVLSVQLPKIRGRRPRISVISSNPTGFRGRRGDVEADEAAFQPDLEGVVKAAGACTTIGGFFGMSSSAGYAGSYAHRLYEMGLRRLDPTGPAGPPQPGDMPIRLRVVTIIDAVEAGLVERLNLITGRGETREAFLERMRGMCPDQETWDREFLCKWSSDGDSYYPWPMLQAVTRADDAAPTASLDAFLAGILAKADAAGQLVAGVDVGRKNDRFVIGVRANIAGAWRLVGMYSARNITFDAMEEAISATMRLSTKSRGRVQRMCIDATGLGMQLAERMAQRFHGRVEGVSWTSAVREDCGSKARAMFEAGEATLPCDPTLPREYNAVRRELTSANNARLVFGDDAGDGGHSDHLAADWMAFHAISSTPTGRRGIRLQGGTAW